MNKIIINSASEKIDYSFEAGAPAQKKDWLVVLGHGVTGNKDRPVVADTAHALNAAGFDTLRFSFAGNGDSDGDFRDATISKEVGDLAAILDVVSKSYAKICYVGHSMGCAVGVIQAAKDDRINALISLAGMIDTKAFAQTEFGSETPDAGLMWEEEDCPLSSAYMQDLCETIQSVAPQVESVKVPWLLLHGTADDVVLPKDTELVKSLKGDGVSTIFVNGADHSFNEPAHKKQATEAVVTWLSEQS
ncbi:alpha/beta hydrolase family protein [Rubellicoccus peritrichatus]|uniref:Alpha/beta fold hydrolase n=1 Tax=Rubellicoccus peritrichatus TaxID=3080537 RepID=A0AAQ3L726_9BACT|nr:alpha/beta fold hydrolase [Puniceicoccus sp. CR14]WOO40754.1 alpha/beta fold hydrolase [Puniceicoccus sp. CR14]